MTRDFEPFLTNARELTDLLYRVKQCVKHRLSLHDWTPNPDYLSFQEVLITSFYNQTLYEFLSTNYMKTFAMTVLDRFRDSAQRECYAFDAHQVVHVYRRVKMLMKQLFHVRDVLVTNVFYDESSECE